MKRRSRLDNRRMWELSAIPSPYSNESESGHAAPDEAALNYLTESIFARSRSGSGEANMTISPGNAGFHPNNEMARRGRPVRFMPGAVIIEIRSADLPL